MGQQFAGQELQLSAIGGAGHYSGRSLSASIFRARLAFGKAGLLGLMAAGGAVPQHALAQPNVVSWNKKLKDDLHASEVATAALIPGRGADRNPEGPLPGVRRQCRPGSRRRHGWHKSWSTKPQRCKHQRPTCSGPDAAVQALRGFAHQLPRRSCDAAPAVLSRSGHRRCDNHAGDGHGRCAGWSRDQHAGSCANGSEAEVS